VSIPEPVLEILVRAAVEILRDELAKHGVLSPPTPPPPPG